MRTQPAVLSALAALALAACGGGTPADTGPPPDVKLDQANRAGTQALSVDMPSLAVREYKVALARAYERDDAGAIADIAYNLALAQMKTGDAKAALATLRDARAELDRRRVQIPAELFLVQAAAAYRTGDLSGAATAAREALDRPAKDPDTAPRCSTTVRPTRSACSSSPPPTDSRHSTIAAWRARCPSRAERRCARTTPPKLPISF